MGLQMQGMKVITDFNGNSKQDKIVSGKEKTPNLKGCLTN